MSTNFPTSLEARPALPTGVSVPRASEASIAELLPFLHWAMDAIVALEAKVGIDSSAVTTSLDYKTATTRNYLTVKSQVFDLDNGAGTTVDEVILRPAGAITLRGARIVYDDATTGTVAAGNMSVGTTVGGTQILAATAYENTKAVGTTTTAALVGTVSITANQAVFVRHTGVAATQAGKAHLELDYTID